METYKQRREEPETETKRRKRTILPCPCCRARRRRSTTRRSPIAWETNPTRNSTRKAIAPPKYEYPTPQAAAAAATPARWQRPKALSKPAPSPKHPAAPTSRRRRRLERRRPIAIVGAGAPLVGDRRSQRSGCFPCLVLSELWREGKRAVTGTGERGRRRRRRRVGGDKLPPRSWEWLKELKQRGAPLVGYFYYFYHIQGPFPLRISSNERQRERATADSCEDCGSETSGGGVARSRRSLLGYDGLTGPRKLEHPVRIFDFSERVQASPRPDPSYSLRPSRTERPNHFVYFPIP